MLPAVHARPHLLHSHLLHLQALPGAKGRTPTRSELPDDGQEIKRKPMRNVHHCMPFAPVADPRASHAAVSFILAAFTKPAPKGLPKQT